MPTLISTFIPERPSEERITRAKRIVELNAALVGADQALCWLTAPFAVKMLYNAARDALDDMVRTFPGGLAEAKRIADEYRWVQN